MKFKKGERVRVRGPVYSNGDRIDADKGLTCTVVEPSKHFPGYWNLSHEKFDVMAHEWQIRRLKPKKKPAPREWFLGEMRCDSSGNVYRTAYTNHIHSAAIRVREVLPDDKGEQDE